MRCDIPTQAHTLEWSRAIITSLGNPPLFPSSAGAELLCLHWGNLSLEKSWKLIHLWWLCVTPWLAAARIPFYLNSKAYIYPFYTFYSLISTNVYMYYGDWFCLNISQLSLRITVYISSPSLTQSIVFWNFPQSPISPRPQFSCFSIFPPSLFLTSFTSFCWCCCCCLLKTGSHCDLWLPWNSLCRVVWAQMHRELPISALQVLGLKMCTLTLAPSFDFLILTFHGFNNL